MRLKMLPRRKMRVYWKKKAQAKKAAKPHLRHCSPATALPSSAAEPAALTRALQQEHLAPALRLVRNQCIATASLQDAGESARGLWLRQMQAADDIVAVDDGAAAALNGPAVRVIGTAEAIALALAGMARTTRG